MKLVLVLAFIVNLLQAPEAPAYIRQGDRVEAEFQRYLQRLGDLYTRLHDLILKNAENLSGSLTDHPPLAIVYGYQVLPHLIDEKPQADREQLPSRAYSWPLTQNYIRGEQIKLDQAFDELGKVRETPETSRDDQLKSMIRQYRDLAENERTIAAHIQYNRFWQRVIASDRSRYDQMTEVYNLLQQKNLDLSRVIREALGTPEVPAYIRVDRSDKDTVVLRVPLYTDIDDDAFLEHVKSAIESFWQTNDAGVQYRVELDLKKVALADLYHDETPPAIGSHLDLRAHAAHFPQDGAVLTTGGQTTYAYVGHFIALSSGEVSYRTIAHEFGHVLGFRDGYVRGYKDIGENGFEIFEMTPDFDDLMSAPRLGSVQITHFQLLLANIRSD